MSAGLVAKPSYTQQILYRSHKQERAQESEISMVWSGEFSVVTGQGREVYCT